MPKRRFSSLPFFLALATLATAAFAQGPTAASPASPADNLNSTVNPADNGQSGNAASPLSFQIGNFSFTPGGFIDFTTMYRSTDVGSGIGTNFAAIPFNSSPSGREGEFRESAQNSRLALRVSGTHGALNLTGYFEGDFLGNQSTNAAVTSNSVTFRMRVYFADAQDGPWEVVAGQDWSLITPGRFGASPMPGDVFYTQDMDTNYQVGLSWSRQPQLRVIYHATPHLAAAISAENPDQYVGGSSGSTTAVLPGGTSGVYAGQVDVGSSNFTSPGFAPDLIGKIAYDTGTKAGQGLHLEVVGLESTFRDFIPVTNTTDRVVGGAFEANAIAAVTPGFRLIATDFIGDGGGRYLFGEAPDIILRQNGTISPVHADGGILGFEAQATHAWLLYGYYGGVWIGNDYDASPTQFTGGPAVVGYGYPGAAAGFTAGMNKSLQEGSIGVVQTMFQSANDGTLQLITQGSYLTRAPWYVATGTPKNAHVGMVFVDLRYVLP